MCSDKVPPKSEGCKKLPSRRQWLTGVLTDFNPDTGETEIMEFGGDLHRFTIVGEKLEEFRKIWIARSPEAICIRIKI